MPYKTFAHGGAGTVRSMVRLAMERPGNERGIISQRPNDRMLVEERQRLLRRRLMLQELSQCAKSIDAVRKGRFTGVFQRLGRMLHRQR